MDATTPPPVRATGISALIQGWLLTLVCPGLGQIRLGAKGRGVATLVVVVGSLVWLSSAALGPVKEFVAAKAGASANVPDVGTLLSWVSDPVLRERVTAAAMLPGWIFFLSVLYSFADSAYLAFNPRP